MSGKKSRLGSNPLEWIGSSTPTGSLRQEKNLSPVRKQEKAHAELDAIDRMSEINEAISVNEKMTHQDSLNWIRNRNNLNPQVQNSEKFDKAIHSVSEKNSVAKIDQVVNPPSYLIVLSAKTNGALKQKIRDLLLWMEEESEQKSILDVEFTLLVGRSHFSHRLSFVVSGMQELKEKLRMIYRNEEMYLQHVQRVKTNEEWIHYVEKQKALLRAVANGGTERKNLQKEMNQLSDLYLIGLDSNWKKMYTNVPYQRISLPTYSFEKERYWIEAKAVEGKDRKSEELNTPERSMVYYVPKWRKLEYDVGYKERLLKSSSHSHYLLVDMDGAMVYQEDRELEQSITHLIPGQQFNKLQANTYSMNLNKSEHYRELFNILTGTSSSFSVIFVWANQATSEVYSSNEETTQIIESTFLPLFHAVQVIHEFELQLDHFALVQSRGNVSNPFVAAIAGLTQSLRYVFPSVAGKMIELVGKNDVSSNDLWSFLKQCQYLEYMGNELRFIGSECYVKEYEPFEAREVSGSKLRYNGVYLITGGTGKLGTIFAKHLAKHYKAKLILLGRSPLNREKERDLKELHMLGAETLYMQVDLANQEDMQTAIAKAKEKFTEIHGVIHAAGIYDSKVLIQKSELDFFQTLRSKVHGTVILDHVTKSEHLDFFVLFSSLASILGDFGQCDYALSNRFLDSFAEYRIQELATHSCHGQTIVINWPLWKDGGMHEANEGEQLYLQSSGLEYLQTDDGIRAFEEILASGQTQVALAVGKKERMNNMFRGVAFRDAEFGEEIIDHPEYYEHKRDPEIVKVRKEETLQHLSLFLEGDLKSIISEIVQIDESKLDVEENIGNYGFDSIQLKKLAVQLNERFQVEVLPTIFYAHPNIRLLAKHLADNFSAELNAYYKRNEAKETKEYNEVKETKEDKETKKAGNYQLNKQSLLENQPVSYRTYERNASSGEPIAVIGIGGILPGANNLEEYWDNLMQEKSLIREIPPERWTWQSTHLTELSESEQECLKWGGFIENVDQFDSKFFNITPLEAELMDPQIRLLLQTVWHTVEDSGYKMSSLGAKNMGVFIGAQFSDYRALVGAGLTLEAQVATGNEMAMLSNRISYQYNFNGPSETITTACSASAVAIHRAVHSIQHGESEMAIAGGVSLMLDPDTFLTVSRLGVLSSDGRCKPFDKKANGYVRGEGVGCIFLKPLSKAMEDGDHIYGVIRGSAENHGGRGHSLTAPNSAAQAELLIQAYNHAGLSPSTLGYIEAHGTGTELGDPVEIEGLKQAFSSLLEQNGEEAIPNQCGIGSVKSNIGHLEPASGIAGIIKVLLSLKHRTIPRSIHLEETNPYINLKGTPFYLMTETKKWEQKYDAEGKPIPRRAGISSFGFGGSNAHLILEEFENYAPVNGEMGQAYLIVLSAKHNRVLQANATALLRYLENKPMNNLALQDIAYTLMEGREHMAKRVAIIADSVHDLIHKLSCFISGKTALEHIDIKDHIFLDDGQDTGSESWLHDAARKWVAGGALEWKTLFPADRPRRLPLPTYSFLKEKHWVDTNKTLISWSTQQNITEEIWLHPLLHQNTSTLQEQMFTSTFSGAEFFIRDHEINGAQILPGTAILEMAFQAMKFSAPDTPFFLKEMDWLKPITFTRRKVTIALYPQGEDIEFEVRTGDHREFQIHACGKLALTTREPMIESKNIEEIISGSRIQLSKKQIYQMFQQAGFHYGHTFQTIEYVQANETQAISKLSLPSEARQSFSLYRLHPAILDGALQTVSGLLSQEENHKQSLFLPFAMKGLELFQPLTEQCFAHVAKLEEEKQLQSEIIKFAVRIYDSNGRLLLRIKEFSTKIVPATFMANEQLLYWLQKLENGELEIDEVERLVVNFSG